MPRWLARIGFVGMALVALVLTHDLAFLAAYGTAYDQALVLTGHGQDWTVAVVCVVLLAGGLVVVAGWQIARLLIELRSLGGTASVRRLERADLAGRLGVTWLRLAAAAGAAYVVQENLERASIGEPLPGLGVLGSAGSPYVLPILAAVTLLVAVVGVLFRWRIDSLAARLAAARGISWVRAYRSRRRSLPPAHRLAGSIHGRLSAGRAPPLRAAVN
ncbi:MAG TPA: hypothetical protein VEG29_07645 [Candidatus Binatia bacterium]|nr:hypothetical protein [Candidatus Binatia bacterium]